jgi:site-specific DNA-methyltransferase (adenine-specific)
MSLNRAMLSSERPDWETPQELFDRLNAIFHFQLDAAASAENKKCDRYFDRDNSAFDHAWTPGPVWLNPPYRRRRKREPHLPGINDFIDRAQAESERRDVTVVCLAPARTDTKWFDIIWGYAWLIIFLRGRQKFVGAESGAPFPSAIAIFSPAPVIERYPNLLATVASIGYAVDPAVLRSSESPNLELNFSTRS